MNTNIIGTIQSIPVASLVLSPRNVRKTCRQSIEGLAASIRAVGLIHNLTVTPANGAGKYEVVAGGRCWRALRLLIKTKALPKDHAVPCKIVAAEDAEDVSLTENTMREAMHPAEEFEAFKTLVVEQGRPIEDVAARYGVTPTVVKQRLKLANVSPKLVALFRADGITLEQMMALAVTDDHAAQERVWEAARNTWQRQAGELRAALTEFDIESRDKRAKYVGTEAYEKAGGLVRRDLFTDTVYFADAELLNRMVDEKLARAAERVRREGWGWVEYRAQHDYAELSGYGRLAPTLRAPTKKERARLDKLDAQEAELQREGEAEDVSDERIDAIHEALDAIAVEREAIDEARIVDDPEARATAGALVMLGHDGKVQVERGLVQRAERTASQEAEDAEDGEMPAKPKEKREISDALTRRLTAERTLALRAALAAQPAHALTVLVHALVLSAFYFDDHSLLHVTVRDECPLHRAGFDADATKAGLALHALETELKDALPAEADALWTWIVAQDQATQLRYLAYCIAPALNTLQDRATSDRTSSRHPVAVWRELAELLGFDMADWWVATSESYCASVSKAQLVAAVEEASGKEAAEPLKMMKKAGAVTAAAAALEGTRWLPSLLRRG